MRVEARPLDATSVLTADLEGLKATSQIKVTRKEEGPAFKILLVPESFGLWRAITSVEEDDAGVETTVIKIAGRHPAIRRAIGDNFEGQNTSLSRVLIAEIIADVAARHVVTKLYRLRSGSEEFDADRIYREHYKRVVRFQPRFQRLLLGKFEPTTKSLPPSLLWKLLLWLRSRCSVGQNLHSCILFDAKVGRRISPVTSCNRLC